MYILQVAFLTSAVGPRVAAACAHAALHALSEDDGLSNGTRWVSFVFFSFDSTSIWI